VRLAGAPAAIEHLMVFTRKLNEQWLGIDERFCEQVSRQLLGAPIELNERRLYRLDAIALMSWAVAYHRGTFPGVSDFATHYHYYGSPQQNAITALWSP
jgi:hypothetical protein